MWNRRRETETSAPPAPQLHATPPSANGSAVPAAAPAPRETEPPLRTPVQHTAAAVAPALIGAELSIVGEVRTSQDLQIAGRVQGPIYCSDAIVSVLPNGHVRGDVHAREVILFGTIEGDVVAKTRLIVRQDARLLGNVSCAAIMIEETAYFKGSIDIVRAAAQEAEDVATATVAAG